MIPKIYKNWLERINERPPQVCYICDRYDAYLNHCKKFEMSPPNEFLEEVNECPEFQEGPPF
jgi:hypothetical protein